MIPESERRERAAAYWFNVVRPKLATPDAKPQDTPQTAAARLMELGGLTKDQLDAIPDAKPKTTFERVKA